MIQLVDVQHRRGATGGQIFADTIKSIDPESSLSESPAVKIDLTENGILFFVTLLLFFIEVTISYNVNCSLDSEIGDTPVCRIPVDEIEQIVESLNLNDLSSKVRDNRQKLLQVSFLFTLKSKFFLLDTKFVTLAKIRFQ